MNGLLAGIALYILLQLAIGLWVSRRIASEDDYLLAGRRLGPGMASLSVFATWFGAETCIGASGAVYEQGLAGATIDPFGYAACLLLMGVVFAIPLWQQHLTTLADLFRLRYSVAIERLAVLLLVPGTLLWAAAQIRAFGQVLAAVSGAEVEWMIALAAAVVIVYTLYGGLLADVVTDAVQGVALIIGLLALLWMVSRAHGGWQAAWQHIDPARLRWTVASSGLNWEVIEKWAVPVCGSVMSQELVSRVLACRAPATARRACLQGGALYLLVGLVPVTLGLFGGPLLPDLPHPEQILPQLAQHYLPPWLYVIFAGALISAILSTVDSALLAASALLSHNLLVPLCRARQPDPVRVARVMVLLGGLIAYVLALHAGRVYELVEAASAFGSAGVFTVVLFGLFTRIGGVRSAAAALLAGCLVWVSAEYLWSLDTPYLWALAAAGVSYIGAAVLEQLPRSWNKTR